MPFSKKLTGKISLIVTKLVLLLIARLLIFWYKRILGFFLLVTSLVGPVRGYDGATLCQKLLHVLLILRLILVLG
jgi:hypothetical protein